MATSENTTISQKKSDIKSSGVLGMKALLVVVSSGFFGKTCIIDKPIIVAGRDEDSDFYINDPQISRTHFAIKEKEKGVFYIEDLASTNNTFVNSKKLNKPLRLHFGDRIVAGATILRFYLEEEIEQTN